MPLGVGIATFVAGLPVSGAAHVGQSRRAVETGKLAHKFRQGPVVPHEILRPAR